MDSVHDGNQKDLRVPMAVGIYVYCANLAVPVDEGGIAMLSKTPPQFRWPLETFFCSRNAALDAIFYDTQALIPAEREQLVARRTPEGAVSIAPPSGGTDPLQFLRVLEFIEQMRDRSLAIDTLAVAGVGSSDLGTAALARNVADFLDRPIAGIVSGQRLLDTVLEGMGGRFFFGYANRWREVASWYNTELAEIWGVHGRSVPGLAGGFSEEEIFALEQHLAKLRKLPRSLLADWLTVAAILLRCNERIELVVGHSKGNYLAASAVDLLVKYVHVRPPKVVTLGAAFYMDEKRVPDQQQVLGNLDWFGRMNARWPVEHKFDPMAGHWIGGGKPAAMQVDRALEMAGVEHG